MFDSIRTIPVRVRPPYDVRIGSGLLGRCGDYLAALLGQRRIAVLADDTVASLYLDTVTAALEDAGFAVCSHIFPSGEGRKNLSTLTELLEFLASEHLTRTDCVAALGGGVVDPLPEDAPFFVKDYYAYYKTDRGYHPRSLNSNGGWNVTGCMSFLNQPILRYSNEIRSAVLVIHGEKAHSCYFSRDAYEDMVRDNPFADNKELLIIPDAVHTDLYDQTEVIPFDKIEVFIRDAMK